MDIQNCSSRQKSKINICFQVLFSESCRPQHFRTPWHYTISKKLGRNSCVNLDNAVLLPPKIALFSPFLTTTKKTFLSMTIKNHHIKWFTPLKTYDLDGRFESGCERSTYFDLGARFVQRSGYYIRPIICKASKWNNRPASQICWVAGLTDTDINHAGLRLCGYRLHTARTSCFSSLCRRWWW